MRRGRLIDCCQGRPGGKISQARFRRQGFGASRRSPRGSEVAATDAELARPPALALIVAVILLIGSGTREMLAPLSAAQQPEISLLAVGTAELCIAHDDADAGGTGRLAVFYVHVRHVGGQEPPRRSHPDSAARRPAIRTGARRSVVHRRFLRLAVSSRTLGVELAAIFAIFTSQAWNMAFSFFQSLRTIPFDLDEASRGFRFSGWQRFWRLKSLSPCRASFGTR